MSVEDLPVGSRIRARVTRWSVAREWPRDTSNVVLELDDDGYWNADESDPAAPFTVVHACRSSIAVLEVVRHGKGESLHTVVAKFLAERDNVTRAIESCPASNMEDYWRWQGHAEARRVLRQDIEREGIDLSGSHVAAIKADAIRELAEAQRQLARDAKTSNGHAEHTDRADWLDDQANAIDPRRLEGAHP